MAAAIVPIIAAAIPVAQALEPLILGWVHDAERIFHPTASTPKTGAVKKSVVVAQAGAAGVALVSTGQATGIVPTDAELGDMVEQAVAAAKAAGTLTATSATSPTSPAKPSPTFAQGRAFLDRLEAAMTAMGALQP
jgi:hypothetical protein